MKLHDLKPAKGAHKKRTRVGRGHAAGQGKTAGRGQKGQGARSGGIKGPYFEGGQLPYVRRFPFKRGFTNLFRIVHQEVSIEGIAAAFKKGEAVNPETLAAKGLIGKADRPVAVLGGGDLKAALNISAHRFTKSAQSKIEAAGGKVEKLALAIRGARATIKLPKKSEQAAVAALLAAERQRVAEKRAKKSNRKK